MRNIVSFRWSFLLALLLLLCSACASSGGTTTTTPAPTAPATQPVSSQQILAGPVTYVALGASDAVGVGTSQPTTQGYVPLIEAHLPQGSHLINLGVSGIRLPEAMQQELPVALTTNPKLVTIWLVANDFVGGTPYNTYMQDLDSLLKQLRSGTKARIVMANLPDLTLLPSFANLSANKKSATVTEIKRWNAQISLIAARYHVTLVDLFAHNSEITSHPDYISGDGFHPSAKGYAQLATLFWQGITQ